MSKSGKVTKTQVMRALAEQLKRRIDEYREKKQRFEEELARDLEQLNNAYGTDIVKMILSAGRAPARKPRTKKIAQPNSSLASNVSANHDPAPVRRRKTRTPKLEKVEGSQGDEKKASGEKKSGGMGITELRPFIEKAVESLKGKEFVRKDIDDMLKTKGLDFDHTYVSFVLRRMDNLEVIGQRPAVGKGPPSNVYKHKALAHPGRQAS